MNLRRIIAVLLLITETFLSNLAYAWPPTYGLEFNLESQKLQLAWAMRMRRHGDSYQGQAPSADGEHKIARELMEKIREACLPDCAVTTKRGKFGFDEWRFEFPSGFGFNMSVDPATVEIQVGPWDLETWKKHRSEIQSWLFDFTAKQGFNYGKVSTQENSAHLNIGIRSAFENDGKAFARYLADYWQTPELGSGLLGDDGYNAPMLGDLSAKQQKEAKKLIDGVNSTAMTPEELARQVEDLVYTKSPAHKDGGYHYQGVGLKYVTRNGRGLGGDTLGDVPFELRANRQPVSAEQAVIQLELQEKRIEYLKGKAAEPVALDLDLLPTNRGGDARSSVDRLTSFYLYLDEMGLADQWERYKKVLPPKLQKFEPHRFVTSRMDWSDKKLVEALDRFSARARKSPSMQKILKRALMEPGASKNPTALQILERMGSLAIDISQPTIAMDAVQKGLSPASDPLCQACLEVSASDEWKEHADAQKLYRKISRLSPDKMKKTPGFWSSCQAFFGLKAAGP